MQVIDIGSGRPVVALAPESFVTGAAAQALGRRFKVSAISAGAGAGDVAAWIAKQGFESVGLIAFGALAPTAFEVAAATPLAALVVVSPEGLPTDAGALARVKAVETPKCVLLGSADRSQGADAPARYLSGLGANVVLVYAAGPDIAADRPEALATAAGDFLDRQGRFAFMTESVAVSA
jgi:hypothetical protein